MAEGSEENIQVIIRCRPLNQREVKNKETSCISTRQTAATAGTQNEIIIRKNEQNAESFRCHGVFMGQTPQDLFFHRSNIASLLDSAIQGYRSCIFAYGQTGAGKTHTIIGDSSTLDCQQENCGILGRSLLYLYGQLQLLQNEAQQREGSSASASGGGGGDYVVRISCLELYQENLYDLLVEERNRTSLAVREHPTEGFFVEGCELVECPTWKSAERVINRALKSRHIGSHDLNHRSNRSHFITEISLEIPDHPASSSAAAPPNEEELYTVRGRMTFVDLAGSERLKSTNSAGKLLQETGSINSSLYVLGKVISGLSKMTDATIGSTIGFTSDYRKDIPYRDSKLTKLLINSLGGASRTMIISCVTEASGSLTESLRTIHFSMSAARIRNRPVRYLDPQQKLILELRDEIKRLKQENDRLKGTLSRDPSLASLTSLEYSPQEGRAHHQLNYRTVESQPQNRQPLAPSLRSSVPQYPSPPPPQHPHPLLQTSSQPTMARPQDLSRSSAEASFLSLSRSKSQRELPKWDGTVSTNSSLRDEKFDVLAREMFRDYLQFEQRATQETKSQMESPFPQSHPLHRPNIARAPQQLPAAKMKARRAAARERSGGGVKIPHIKEGSARVLSKPKGPNPYTAHLRKSKSSSRQPRQAPSHRAYPAPHSAFPDLSPPARPAPRAPGGRGAVESLPEIQLSRRQRPPQEQPQPPPDPRQGQGPPCDDLCPFIEPAASSQPSPSAISHTKLKLQQLESQLQRQRKEIEADPSRATREKWRRLEALEDEAREMKLELHLSEQLQTLFTPLGPPAEDPVAHAHQPQPQGPSSPADHFPVPAMTTQAASPLSASPSKASSSSPSRGPLASLTTKTEDSLTYSSYHPSDTLPPSSSPSSSTYLDTLHGERIPSPLGSSTAEEGQGQRDGGGEEDEGEEYQDDEFEAEEALYGDEEFESF